MCSRMDDMADDSTTIELSMPDLRELTAGDDPTVGADHVAQAWLLAPPIVVDILRRYPLAPPGGGRVGELIRQLDASLR